MTEFEAQRREKEERERGYRAEGRIEVEAAFLSNPHGRWFLPGAGQTESFRDLDTGPEMVVIPAGEFWMGSKDDEGHEFERPRHKVTIPVPFAVGRYPVTFEEWDAAFDAGRVERKPSDIGWGRGRRPVNGVWWNDAQAYVEWLSFKTGKPYRLLSEAEWEYCCRAGAETAYSFGESPSGLEDYAWYSENSGGKIHPVGVKAANKFGLFDMHGNACEWCQDCWNNTYEGAPSDGSAWAAGNCRMRVTRGGSWASAPSSLRSASRGADFADRSFEDFLGLRVARTLAL
jgi:formylglycine-generating enzyme required for sulfatase activity